MPIGRKRVLRRIPATIAGAAAPPAASTEESPVLVAGEVPGDEALGRALGAPPARALAARNAALTGRRGVPAQAGDHRVHMALVGIRGDPGAPALLAPAHERARGHRA